MKEEETEYKSTMLLRSSQVKTNTVVDPLVKIEEEEEETRLKRRLRSQFSKESSSSDPTELEEQTKANQNRYCKECNYTYSSARLYRIHQRQIHLDKNTGHDYNICNKRFKREHYYRMHIKNIHNKNKYYCHFCKKQLSRKNTYDRHMKSFHGVNMKDNNHTILFPDKTPDPKNPNFYCNACDYTFPGATAFRIHLIITHTMMDLDMPKVQGIRYPDNTPDIYDPNNFCNMCDHTFCKKSAYYNHLQYKHNIEIPLELKGFVGTRQSHGLKVDLNRCYCNVCDHVYSSKRSYRLHIFKMHDTFVENLCRKTKTNELIEPDINDPNYFCKACEKKFLNKLTFSQHLALFHAK